MNILQKRIKNTYLRLPKPIDRGIYKLLKFLFKGSSLQTQQQVLNWMPDTNARFDLTSFFISLKTK